MDLMITNNYLYFNIIKTFILDMSSYINAQPMVQMLYYAVATQNHSKSTSHELYMFIIYLIT
jgi:hypothetical protein